MGSRPFLTDATVADSRLDPHLEQARALICTYSDPDRAYAVCRQARTTYGIESVVAHVSHPTNVERFEHLDVRTSNPALDQPTLLALQATNPVAFMLLSRADDDKEVREVIVKPGNLEGKYLRQLQFPGDVLVLAVQRRNGILIPHGSTRLESGDHLTLVGSVHSLKAAETLFDGAGDARAVVHK
ncbi:MAG TPA: TrkA C-terminal domain-containing protein [Chloroflexota bacterium]|nr:TrkA C-terminal domain-containing protein [Chloroflexota bacterium]